MKKSVLILLCILLLLGGCAKKTEPLTFEESEAYVSDFSDSMLVLHPKGTSPDTLIVIETDTTDMDIVLNDGFYIKGTAQPLKKAQKSPNISNKIRYTMDESCIISQKFKSDSIDITEEVLYVREDFIVINVSRRNIKVYCDGTSFAVGNFVTVKGIAQKIEPEIVFRSDNSEIEIKYAMNNAVVIKETDFIQ